MTIEKHGNKYRIRQKYKGKLHVVTVDHKPSQKEATILMAEALQNITPGSPKTIRVCVDDYIRSKDNVLSPSSIKGYRAIYRNSPEWFMNINVYDVTQIELQQAVNEYSETHSPKTTRNFHALMMASIKMYRPTMIVNTTLPQKKAHEVVVPDREDIVRLLEAMKEHDYYPCIVLGCLGLRRSEVIALTPSDFADNSVVINKAIVANENSKYVLKGTKTTASTRTVYVPSEIVEIIKNRGYVYKGYPNTLIEVMHRYQDKIGMPRCRFHDLRHFYVSYAHSIGMSDADIMSAGGWKTDNVMKRVYRHSMNDAQEQERVAKSMFSAPL
jgi:integrase